MKRLTFSFALLFVAVAGVVRADDTTVRFSDEADTIQTVAWEDAEINTVTWQSRVSQLEAELVSMRQQIDNQSMIQPGPACDSCGGGGCSSCGGGCDSGCGGGCGYDPCVRNSGVYFGAEAAFLKPHASKGIGAGGVGTQSIETDYDPAARLWLGWQNCDGLGFRIRYFEFDHGYSEMDGNILYGHDFRTYVIDAEVTDTTRLGCNWDATLSLGFRYLEYDEAVGQVNGPLVFARAVDFEGYGLVLGAELRRSVTCNLSLYANVRGSMVYGDNVQFNQQGVMPSAPNYQENTVASIMEIQIGAEYTRPIGCNANFFVRGGFEGQYWDSITFGASPLGQVADNDGAFGLGGFTIAAGITR